MALFAATSPPSIADIISLDAIDTYHPGCYVGGLQSLDIGHHDHVYVGSATSPGQGLDYRVHRQHENPCYWKRK